MRAAPPLLPAAASLIGGVAAGYSSLYFPFTTAKNLIGFGPEHSELMSRMDRMQMILVLAVDAAHGFIILRVPVPPETSRCRLLATSAAQDCHVDWPAK